MNRMFLTSLCTKTHLRPFVGCPIGEPGSRGAWVPSGQGKAGSGPTSLFFLARAGLDNLLQRALCQGTAGAPFGLRAENAKLLVK